MRNLLVFMLGFMAVGALGGGGALLLSPDGKMLHLSSAFLEHSPFDSYLVPGAILFLVLGLLPLGLALALVRPTRIGWPERLNLLSDMQWPWTFSIYTGFAVIIWIQVQVSLLHVVFWMQAFFVGWGLAIIALALLPSIRKQYKKPE